MLCLNLVYRNLNCLTRYPLLTTLWLRFLFLLNLRKAPSPVVLVSKEPEKNTERLGKGAKSNKDLKRYITWASLTHSTLDEFENGDFTLKTHQVLTVHTATEEFKHPPPPQKKKKNRSFWICVWRNLWQGSRMIMVRPSFSKSSVFKMFFCLHKNTKRTFSNSSGLKSVFEKLSFQNVFLSTCTKTQSGRFQLPSVWRVFLKSSFFWRISVDGRPNRIDKATFSNSLSKVWTGS